MDSFNLVSMDKATQHIVRCLIGIKGNDEHEVIAYILRNWSSEHMKELETYGISVTWGKATRDKEGKD